MAILGLLPSVGISLNSDFEANKIIIQGLERIPESTAQSSLGIKASMPIDNDSINQGIKRLYKTNYFQDIQVKPKDGNLLVKVQERPLITSIEFKGNKKLETKDLNKILEMAKSTSGSFYNPEVLFKIKQSLLTQYSIMGYYSAKIDIIKTSLANNNVSIVIDVSEGKKAEINRINIMGNNVFNQDLLLDQLTIKVPSIYNLWGIFSNSTVYSPNGLRSALEDLTNYYFNHGYLDFHITSHQSSLTNDKENAFLAFNVTEGAPYTINNVDIVGDLVGEEDKINALITIKKDNTFSKEAVINIANNIASYLKNKGYAFAKVNPVPNIDQDTHSVAVTFYVTPGRKVYVRQINFLGNNVTNDYVYRREMQYYETGLYDENLINQSKIKLQRLKYVENVGVTTDPVPGTDDMVDLNYNIKERSANSISANLGWSDLYHFMVGGSLDLPNVLGTGNTFSISGQVSEPYQSINMSYMDPYFTQAGISQTANVYVNKTNYEDTSIADYELNQVGATLNYQVPLSAFSSFNFGAGLDWTEVKEPSGGISTIISTLTGDKSQASYISGLVNAGWSHNSTNRAYFPTQGNTLSFNAQASVPGSDLQWYKLSTSASIFYPVLFDQSSLSIKGGIGYGNGYGNTSTLPFYLNYFGGGWGSVRGYMQGGMGPTDTYISSDGSAYQGDAVGGNLNIYLNIDLLFALPGVKDSSSMRWGVFFDAGNVYNTSALSVYNKNSNPGGVLWPSPEQDKYPNLSNLRYSVGIEFQWLSPVGPLAFSIAQPLNKHQGDDTEVFQFTLGTSF